MAQKTQKQKGMINTKVFDVAKPGQTAPEASSRPVIVSNRPILQDPMMVAVSSNQAEATIPPVQTGSRLIIKPLIGSEGRETSGAAFPVNEDKAELVDKTIEPIANGAASAPAKTASAIETVPAADVAAPESAEASREGDPSPAEKTKAQEEASVAEAEAKHQAELDKLAESQRYFLPLNAVEKRRSERAVVLGALLILLLGLAWADIALDVGLIHVSGIKPVTHFFHNK